MKIYLASSWKNEYFPCIVERLRTAGFDVYDFRNPPIGNGFKWSYISENYMEWSPEEFKQELYNNFLAREQYQNDIEAMESCDACVLLLPCGRSAHTEAGWFKGKGKKVIAFLPEITEPELMYGIFDNVCCTVEDVIDSLHF